MNTGTRGAKDIKVPLELELQVVENYLMWLLGTKLQSSERVCAVNHQALSPALWSKENSRPGWSQTCHPAVSTLRVLGYKYFFEACCTATCYSLVMTIQSAEQTTQEQKGRTNTDGT